MDRNARLEAVLNKFGKYVTSQAKANLTRQKRNVGKTLYNSIGYDFKVNRASGKFYFKFYMEDYGQYQDLGVHGKKSSPISAQGSPFKYTNKMPPPKAFGQWAIKRGLDGVRDKKTGRFISRKSLQYAIARSIYNHGIPATKFFSKPFGVAFKNLPPDIVSAFKIQQSDFKAV